MFLIYLCVKSKVVIICLKDGSLKEVFTIWICCDTMRMSVWVCVCVGVWVCVKERESTRRVYTRCAEWWKLVGEVFYGDD